MFQSIYIIGYKEFVDTKWVIRIRISKNRLVTQWPKGKVQKDKQRSTKHTHETKDRVTRTPLKIGGELRCSGSVRSSCSTSGTRRVNLVKYLVISHVMKCVQLPKAYITFRNLNVFILYYISML